MSKTLSLDDETIHQVNYLCELWGARGQRNFSYAVSRAVERAFVQETLGVRIEVLSNFDASEFTLLMVTLIDKLETLKKSLYQTSIEFVMKEENEKIVTTEITRLESLIEKIKRAK